MGMKKPSVTSTPQKLPPSTHRACLEKGPENPWLLSQASFPVPGLLVPEAEALEHVEAEKRAVLISI